MASKELDNVDQGILYLLQQNARSNTTEQMGEKIGVSSSTVANRIAALEERNIISGYSPTINYGNAGIEHHQIIIGTVPLEEQEEIAEDVMDATGVVGVREILTNNQNLSVEVIAYDQNGIEQSISELNEAGVDIERIEMMKRERVQPFNHFGKQFTSEDSG